MTYEPMSLLPAAMRIAERRGMKLPVLEWSLRVCRADMTSSHGFRWPFPGRWAYPPPLAGRKFTRDYPCPQFDGDGLCVARTWAGTGSGGLPLGVVVLVGWHPHDVLCSGHDKLRVRRAFVADTFTLASLLAERAGDEAANLQSANLQGADLRDADLQDADLRGANLRGANLQDADLRGADLQGAGLQRANLQGAYLRDADLQRANLQGAGLQRANLQGAVGVPSDVSNSKEK